MIFKGEEDPTSIPGDCFYADSSFVFSIKFSSYFRYLLYFALDLTFLYSNDCVSLINIVEWICWLNGQRRKAPTPEV